MQMQSNHKLRVYLETPKGEIVGHYYSEMHVPTPQEMWSEALERSIRDMGFVQIKIEYKTLYICEWCGCLVARLAQHLSKCPAGDKSESVDRMIDRAMDLIESLPGPIELLKLLKLCEENSISAYALNCAIEAMLSQRKITRQGKYTESYQDTIIARVEEPKEESECQPES